MAGYYVYILGDDDHIVDRVEVITADDEEAKRLARQLVADRAIELWQEARKIARFEPQHSLRLRVR